MHRKRVWSSCVTSAVFPLKKQRTFWASLPQQSNVTGGSQKPGSMGKCKGIIDARSESNPITSHLIANCRFPIVDSFFQLEIGNRQLATVAVATQLKRNDP